LSPPLRCSWRAAPAARRESAEVKSSRRRSRSSCDTTAVRNPRCTRASPADLWRCCATAEPNGIWINPRWRLLLAAHPNRLCCRTERRFRSWSEQRRLIQRIGLVGAARVGGDGRARAAATDVHGPPCAAGRSTLLRKFERLDATLGDGFLDHLASGSWPIGPGGRSSSIPRCHLSGRPAGSAALGRLPNSHTPLRGVTRSGGAPFRAPLRYDASSSFRS
jgi:hypothetical protein